MYTYTVIPFCNTVSSSWESSKGHDSISFWYCLLFSGGDAVIELLSLLCGCSRGRFAPHRCTHATTKLVVSIYFHSDPGEDSHTHSDLLAFFTENRITPRAFVPLCFILLSPSVELSWLGWSSETNFWTRALFIPRERHQDLKAW